MKKRLLYLTVVVLIAASSCTPTQKLTKKEAYPNMYEEKPITIIVMPPINRSTHAEAKEWFLTTLAQPFANKGFYVFPTFLTTEILKNESAYDSESFLQAPLNKFYESFGADAILFTSINEWDKSSIGSKITVDLEYILKSAKTNEVLWTKKGRMIYDTSVDTGIGGIWGIAADVVAGAIKTAATSYVPIAQSINVYVVNDIPVGKYHDQFMLDEESVSSGPELKYIGGGRW
jgi:hypothetical protein